MRLLEVQTATNDTAESGKRVRKGPTEETPEAGADKYYACFRRIVNGNYNDIGVNLNVV